jgi:hypothetical protein
MRTADVCYQSQHRGAVELFAIRVRAGKRCIDCHHYPLKKGAPKKDCAGCARKDSAVKRLACEFYLLINVTVVRVLQTLASIDNVV